MRILVVTYSSNLNGGANRSLLMVLENLKKFYDYELKVLLPSKGVLCNELDKINIPWEIHDYYPIGMVDLSSIKGMGRYIKYSINAKKNQKEAEKRYLTLKEQNYDIVYLNNNGSSYGALLAKLLNIPYVWHFRGEIYEKAKFLNPIAGLIRECNRIIAISMDMKELYQKNNIMALAPIDVVLNGIDLTGCKPSSQNRDQGFHIIQCGRIANEKCQLDAIKAVEIVAQKHEDVRLHIVGSAYGVDGVAYEKKIEKYVNDHKLNEIVIFEGYRDDVGVFRENMNCELICSIREPFGRVTIEGMRSGLIVIGADTGGTKEIIKDESVGVLFRQGDSEDLAKKIIFAYENIDKATKIAQQGMNYSKTHFLPKETVEGVNTIFENVLYGRK